MQKLVHPDRTFVGSSRRHRIVGMLALAAGSVLAPVSTHAATLVWDGSAGTDFEAAANWTPEQAPVGGTTYASVATAGDYIQLQDPTGIPNQPQVTITRAVGGLTFTQSGWTVGTSSASNVLTVGGTQQFGLGIVSSGVGTNTIDANVAIAGRNSNSVGFTVNADNTLRINGNLSTAYAGTSGSFSGVIEKIGAGILELNGTGSLSRFTVSAGTVKVVGGTGGLGTGGATLKLNGTAVYDVIGADVTARPDTHASTSTITNSNTAGTTRTFNIAGSTASNTTFGNMFSGNLNVNWSNESSQTPTYTVSRTDNSYTGYTRLVRPVTVAALADGSANSSIGASSSAAGNLLIGSTLTYTGGATSTNRNFTAIGNATIESSGTGPLSWTGTMTPHTAAMTLTLGGTNTGLNELSSNITNFSGAVSTSLTKSGAGTWLVSGANDYRGTTNVTGGGILEVKTLANAGAASGIGASTVANVNVASAFYLDGALRYTGAGSSTNRLFTINSAVGAATIDSSGSSGAISFTNANALGTFLQTQSPVNYNSGATSITVRDPSKLVVGMGILNGNNSIASGTVITNIVGSTVTLSNATLAGTDSGQTLYFVGGPRSLVLAGSNTAENSMGSVIADPSATFATGTRTTTSTADNTTKVTKSGVGVWTLTNSNTYSGGTTVTAGTLLVNNTSGSGTGTGAVSVNGGTLGGTGAIGGDVTVTTGTLSPGNSPGRLDVGSLTLASGAVTLMEIGGATVDTLHDNVTSTGATTYGGTLNIVSFGGYDLAQEGTYDLFDFGSNTGSSFGFVNVGSLALTNNLGLWTATDGPTTYTFAENTGVLAVVVPEPATATLLLAAFGALSSRRRRA